jgi:ElaB/YqjD/DUF883 family membrane-anchored ribosome-binding protein
MASQTEQLERETEEVRADLSHTLDELRERMTAGQLVDQVIDYTGTDLAVMAGNLRRQVVQNPLALGLIGAGLTWLMMPARTANGGISTEQMKGLGRSASGKMMSAGNAAAGGLEEAATSGSDILGAAGRQASERVAAAGEQLAGSANAAAEAVSERYEQLAQNTGEVVSQVKQTAASLSRNVAETTQRASRGFVDACRDQPLILAGLGLAIGAAIGAAIPRTASEDHLMGSTSDDMKQSAAAFAGEKMEEAKEAVQQTVGEMEKAAAESGAEDGANAPEAPSIIPTPGESAARDGKPAGGQSAYGGA